LGSRSDVIKAIAIDIPAELTEVPEHASSMPLIYKAIAAVEVSRSNSPAASET